VQAAVGERLAVPDRVTHELGQAQLGISYRVRREAHGLQLGHELSARAGGTGRRMGERQGGHESATPTPPDGFGRARRRAGANSPDGG